MKAAICSNDEEARYYLETIILTYHKAKAESFEAFEFATGEEAYENPVCFDLVFLDIDTDNIKESNIEKKLLAKNENTKIIYIKEQSEFLKRAYPKAAIYTIPKPLDAKEVFAFLDRYFYFERISADRHTIILKSSKTVTDFYAEDMIYFEKKMFGEIKTVSHLNETVIKGKSEKAFETALACGFFPISSKTVINLEYVDAITADFVVMINGEKLPISKKLRISLMEALNDYLQQKILPVDIILGKSRITPS